MSSALSGCYRKNKTSSQKFVFLPRVNRLFISLLSFSRTHMQDLKDVTNNVHYENYRSRKLAAVTYNGVDNNKNKGQLTK